jgi:PAS domain S-box/PAS domain S-box/PAS domain S-box
MLILCHYCGCQFDLDQLFHSQHLGMLDSGRMAITTDINFILFGLALLCNTMNSRMFRIFSQFSILVVLCLALATLTGYVYDRSSPPMTALGVLMAFPTAIMFCLASLSLLLMQRNIGIVTVLSGETQGDRIVRRLMPVAIFAPILIGWFRIIGQSAGLYDTAFGAAIMAVSLSIVLSGSIWWYSKSLNKSECARMAAEVQLNKEKQLLESILESLSEGVLVVDMNGRFLKHNSAAEILGLMPTDQPSEKWPEIWGCYLPDRVTLCAAQELPLVRAMRGQSVNDVHLLVRNNAKPDGVFVSVNARPLRLTDGNHVGGVLVLRDISRRRELDEIRSQLAAVVEYSQDAIITKSLDGTIQTWNKGAESIFGYTAEEMIGKSIFVLIPENLLDEEPMVLERLRRGETVSHYETVRRAKNGRLIEVSLSVSPIIDTVGNIVGASKIARDITERKRAEERLSVIIEASPSGIIMVDEKGTIVLINSQIERLFGYSRHELLGQPMDMIVPEAIESDHCQKLMAETKAGWMGIGRDLYGEHKNGTHIPVEIALNPLIIDKSAFVLASVVDIAQRKRVEEGLRIARDQAQAASEFKSEFVATMSHEIRTPMNAIIGMCNLLMKTPLSETQRKHGQHIKEASRTLLNLINDILDLSKIEAGKLDLEIVEFELLPLIESTTEMLAGQARAKDISLVSFVEPAMPLLLRGDPDRLRQVFLNLLSNAIKFSENGEVAIRATITAEEGNTVHVHFSVDDCGIGLSEEASRKVFQPFVQADASINRKYGGTGLGLSICSSLVTLMGGDIGVNTERGKGSSFWFQVPLEKRSEQTVIAKNEELKNLRILLVDDQKHARETLHEYIVSWGMRNDVANSGSQALTMMREAYIEGDPFKLAIIDLVMPEMNGVDLATAIRNDPAVSATQLILLTAFDAPGLGRQAIEIGFGAFLTKPVQQSQLLNSITNLLHGIKPKIYFPAADDPQITHSLRPEYVLIVEDHPINQQVVLQYVSELGLMSYVANNGQDALEALSRNQYGLILMDCQMPILDGFAATKAIRKNEALTGHHIPIIAMTANAMKGDREKCLAAGMDDYLSKPIEPDELSHVIGKWLPAEVPAAVNVSCSKGVNGIPIEIEVAELPLLNLKKLETRLGKRNARQLLSAFFETGQSSLLDIKNAIDARDAIQLADSVHAFKGVCATLCAEQLVSIMVHLENGLDTLDWDSTLNLANDIESCFEQTKVLVGQAIVEENDASNAC